MEKYLVSICVPTYNRLASLSLLLESYVKNVLAGGSDLCQLCVNDNASTDDSINILKAYADRYPQIKIGRNKENLGFGPNFYQAAKLADGQFVFFCGDDDRLCEDALATLLSLARLQSDLVIINSDHVLKFEKDGFKKGQLISLRNPFDYMRRIGLFHASFIGNLFFRRETLLQADPGDALAMSAYPQMVPVLRLLSNNGGVFANCGVVEWGDSARAWKYLQPIYTSIDMARIVTNNVDWSGAFWLKQYIYVKLIRSLPTAIWFSCGGVDQVSDAAQNPYKSVAFKNLRAIYSQSVCCLIVAYTLSIILPIISYARARLFSKKPEWNEIIE